jgi:uncharacterized protein (DUF1330 family)
MPAYVVSDGGPIAREDEASWNAYLALAPSTLQKYGGRYLARGGEIDVLEGHWSPAAMVIVEFPDRGAAGAWYASPEYAEALALREGSGLRRNLIVVEGAVDASAAKLLGANFVRPDGA